MKRAVEQRVAAVRGRLATRLRALLPGARVEETRGGVTVSGRQVVRRWIDDPALRWWWR